jgi:3-methyladenine DNA glycosylase/8-oxoguanine DNA glycosylase
MRRGRSGRTVLSAAPSDSLSRTIVSPLPIDLRATVSPLAVGANDPTMYVDRRQVWRASHTPAGPALLHLRVIDATTIEATGWGQGRDWMLDAAADFVGANDDLAGFDASAHTKMQRAHRRHPGLRIARSGLIADHLVPAILGQKVTGIQAKKAWHGLVRKHGHDAPGPADTVSTAGPRRTPLRLPPTMAEIGAMPYWAFHSLGVEQRRAETVIRSARRIDRLQEAAQMGHDDALRRLTALPGLGPWTAGLLQRLCLGDPDGIEVGDYHLPDMVAFTLAGEPRGTDARMLELLAPFAGHRGRALELLKIGGSGKPAYGPRMTIHAVEKL